MQRSNVFIKKSVLIIAVMLFLLVIPMVSGEPSFFFKKDVASNFSFPVFGSNNTPISSTGICTLNMRTPSGETILQNQSMIFVSDGLFVTLINSTNLNSNGEHPMTVVCTDGADAAFTTFTALVTISGAQLTTARAIMWFMALFLGLVLFGLSLWGAIRIPFANQKDNEGFIVKINDLKHVKTFLWFAAYMILLWVAFLAYNITDGFLFFNVASNFLKVVFWILLVGVLPVLIITMLTFIFSFFSDRTYKKLFVDGFKAR